MIENIGYVRIMYIRIEEHNMENNSKVAYDCNGYWKVPVGIQITYRN